MDPQEIRDKIMAAINGLIQSDDEKSVENLHAVLTAKMQNRINPPKEVEPQAAKDTDNVIDLDLDLDIDKDLPPEE